MESVSGAPSVWEGHKEIYDRITEESTSRWGRLKVECCEVNQSKEIQHVYDFSVNKKTGEFYLDCNKSKLFCKLLSYAIVEPVILAAKTIYHLLLPVSIPLAIFKEVQKIREEEATGTKVNNKTMRVIKACWLNVVDIVRTPCYAVALAAVAVAGVLIGPFAPRHYLSSIRALAGKIELALMRGESRSGWIVYACFQPVENIKEFKDWRELNNVTYPQMTNPTEKGMITWVMRHVEFRRKHRALFNDCMRKLGPESQYVSPGLSQERGAAFPASKLDRNDSFTLNLSGVTFG